MRTTELCSSSLIIELKWITADNTLNMAPQWHRIPGITVYNLLVMITLWYSTIGDLNLQFECVFCHISRHIKMTCYACIKIIINGACIG